jgi:hypothetical protein
MKPIKLILVVLCFVCLSTVESQTKLATSVYGGYSEDGFATMANLQIYPEHVFKNYYEIGIYAGFLTVKEKKQEISLDVYTVNAGYHFRINQLSSMRNTVVTTFGLGGVIGKEILNNGSDDLPSGALILTRDGLVYGAYGALETDFYLSDKISILGRYTHFYHANSDVGESKFMVGLVLKYIFI